MSNKCKFQHEAGPQCSTLVFIPHHQHHHNHHNPNHDNHDIIIILNHHVKRVQDSTRSRTAVQQQQTCLHSTNSAKTELMQSSQLHESTPTLTPKKLRNSFLFFWISILSQEQLSPISRKYEISTTINITIIAIIIIILYINHHHHHHRRLLIISVSEEIGCSQFHQLPRQHQLPSLYSIISIFIIINTMEIITILTFHHQHIQHYQGFMLIARGMILEDMIYNHVNI